MSVACITQAGDVQSAGRLPRGPSGSAKALVSETRVFEKVTTALLAFSAGSAGRAGSQTRHLVRQGSQQPAPRPRRPRRLPAARERISVSSAGARTRRVLHRRRNLPKVRAILAAATLLMGGLMVANLLIGRSSGRLSARRRRWLTAVAVIVGVSWLFFAAVVAGIVGPSE